MCARGAGPRDTLPQRRGVVMFRSRPRSRKVLIVDDESVPRSLESVALEGTARYRTSEAANATDAITLLSDGAFDGIVIDLDMPDMSGEELVRMIRANRESAHLPIVLVLPETASDDEDGPEFHAGANEVIRKPFEPWDLAQLLDKLTGATDDEHALSVESVLRGFPHPTMILDPDHHVILANHPFYDATGTGISEEYTRCMDHMHGDRAVPRDCPLDEAVRTGEPAERTIDTVVGPCRVSVYPLSTVVGNGTRLFLHVTQPTGAA